MYKSQTCRKITDEQKPAIGKVIAPSALFWFRWAALSNCDIRINCCIFKWICSRCNGFGYWKWWRKHTAIGIGMWLGIIMAINVWFVIWPIQKKVLGIVEATPEEKPKSAKRALIASRTNTLLSLPMLLSMVAAQNLY